VRESQRENFIFSDILPEAFWNSLIKEPYKESILEKIKDQISRNLLDSSSLSTADFSVQIFKPLVVYLYRGNV